MSFQSIPPSQSTITSPFFREQAFSTNIAKRHFGSASKLEALQLKAIPDMPLCQQLKTMRVWCHRYKKF